jgi:DNA-binding response OmpR family regulator
MESKILVVDNDSQIRELLYDALTKVGYKVSTTHSGKEALELARKQSPELILLDFKMPDMDGVALLEKIRCFDQKTKVLMITGFADDELERRARLAGASGFLRKTLGIDVILKAINDILQPKKRYGQEKILVVDDDQQISSLIRDFLSKKGFNVITAASGEEGLEKFKTEKPILVLLDVKLPGIDGILTLKRIREIDDKVGVIMITGVLDEAVLEEVKKFGVFEYIVKPFDLDYLETCALVRICLVSALLE